MDTSIKRLLANDQTLTTLELYDNGIGDDGARELAVALQQNATLTTLDLDINRIGADGARALADALQKNQTLTTLDIGSNEIGMEGARAFADALRENRTLTTLYLDSNEIGDDGARALADALQQNRTLTTLDIDYNRIGDDGARALADALQKNRTLTTLDISYNEIGDDGWLAIKDGIRQNGMITSLDFDNVRYACKRYLDRNRQAHERVRNLIAVVLREFQDLKNMKLDERPVTNHLFNWLLTKRDPDRRNYLRIGPDSSESWLRKMTDYLWSTRGDPIWWTAEERKEAGLQLEGEVKSGEKKPRIEIIETCIQCSMEARFHELDAPKRLFCGSYCQWLEHTKLPDLRGKSPEQAIHLINAWIQCT